MATVVTKLQVPVMYAIFVLDFKILKWETAENELPAPPIDATVAQTQLQLKELRFKHEKDPAILALACVVLSQALCTGQEQSPAILKEYDQAIDQVAERAMQSVVEIEVTGYRCARER